MPRIIPMLALCAACAGPPGPPGADGADGTIDWPRGTGTDPLPGLAILEGDIVWSQDTALQVLTYVPAGSSLTIEDGVTVDLWPSAGLVVDGTLHLAGTTPGSVRFEDMSLATASNQGVAVGGIGNPSTIANAAFSSVDLVLTGDPTATVTAMEFDDSTLYIRERTTPLLVSDSSFTGNLINNQTAISARDLPELTVSGITASLVGYGVEFEGLQDGAILTVLDSDFSDISRAVTAGGIGGPYTYEVLVQGVTILRSSTYGLYFDRSNAVVRDVDLQGANWQGILTGLTSTLTVEDSFVSDTGSIGIHHASDGLVVSNTTVFDVVGDGINGVNDITLTDVVIDGANNCIDADGDGLVGTNLTLTGCRHDGVESSGDTTLTGLTITQPGTYGVYAIGTLDLSLSTISDSGNTGVFCNTNATIDQTTITNTGYFGAQIVGALTATNLTLDTTVSYGLYISNGGSVVNSTLANTGADALYFIGSAPAELRRSNVINAGGFGVRGQASGVNAFDLVENNITGSANQAVYEAQVMNGNYIADNFNQVGPDLAVGGVLDGVRDFDSLQLADIDYLVSPAAAPVPDTGPL